MYEISGSHIARSPAPESSDQITFHSCSRIDRSVELPTVCWPFLRRVSGPAGKRRLDRPMSKVFLEQKGYPNA